MESFTIKPLFFLIFAPISIHNNSIPTRRRIIMRKKTSLNKLMVAVCSEMERLGYAKNSTKEFQAYAKRYGRFAESVGEPDVFSEKLAAEFLKQRYDYPSQKADKRYSSTIYSAVYSMRRLGDYHLHKSFNGIWKKTRTGFEWANKDVEYIKAYFESVQNSDDSPNTNTMRIY